MRRKHVFFHNENSIHIEKEKLQANIIYFPDYSAPAY